MGQNPLLTIKIAPYFIPGNTTQWKMRNPPLQDGIGLGKVEFIPILIHIWEFEEVPEKLRLQFAHDIALDAMRQLGKPKLVENAKNLAHCGHPEVQELHVLDYSYSILFLVDNELRTIHVLRFWSSHRE